MSAYPITSSYELHQLIPYVPVMLNWLREVNPATAADVFLRVNKPQVGKQDLIVNFAFQGLLQEIFKSDSDLTITQIKIIFSSYEVQVRESMFFLSIIPLRFGVSAYGDFSPMLSRSFFLRV